MDDLFSNAVLVSENESSARVSEQQLSKKERFQKVFGDTIICKETTGSLTSSERVKKEMVMYFQTPSMDIDEKPLK